MTTATAPVQGKPFDQVLAEQCSYWQEVLRLQDWNIDVRLVRPHEMAGDKSPVAQTEVYEHRKDAIMRFLHPMDLITLQSHFLFGEEKDYDLNIVHELLHLHFAPFQEAIETSKGTAQEQAIEAISRAIVKLHRHGKPQDLSQPLDMVTETHSGGHYV